MKKQKLKSKIKVKMPKDAFIDFAQKIDECCENILPVAKQVFPTETFRSLRDSIEMFQDSTKGYINLLNKRR